MQRAWRNAMAGILLILALYACQSNSKPAVLEDPKPPEPGAPGPDSGGQECFVNFQSMLQLKVSAKPGSDALEVLDANPIAIPSIPIQVKGDEVAILGEKFPDYEAL